MKAKRVDSRAPATNAREQVAQWMTKHSFSTGHGDTLKDLLGELTWQVGELRASRAPATTPTPHEMTHVECRCGWYGLNWSAHLLAQAAAPGGKEPALGKVSFQLLTEKDVAEAYQAAPDWFTVLSALECRGKEPPRDETDFGSAEEVIAGLDRINEHNRQVAAQDKPPADEP